MKKVIVIAVLFLIVTAFATAGGFDWHIGLGYSASYVGDLDSINTSFNDENWFPFGIGTYVGAGYGFGYNKAIAIGVEYSFTWSFQSTFIMSVMSNQFRGYLKWKPGGGGIFSLALLGGGASDRVTYAGIGISDNLWSGMVGARVTVLFLYGEYAMVFLPEGIPPRSAFTFGVAFKK